MVGHEERVEPATLEGLREPLQLTEVEVRIGKRTGVPPSARVKADGAHEGAELELLPTHDAPISCPGIAMPLRRCRLSVHMPTTNSASSS